MHYNYSNTEIEEQLGMHFILSKKKESQATIVRLEKIVAEQFSYGDPTISLMVHKIFNKQEWLLTKWSKDEDRPLKLLDWLICPVANNKKMVEFFGTDILAESLYKKILKKGYIIGFDIYPPLEEDEYYFGGRK